MARTTKAKKRIALLIPAHNEELVLDTTVKSALQAGQSIEDIFIVNDGSKDKTEEIAIRLVGKRHVLSTFQGGKAAALKAGSDYFKLPSKYSWIHISDADGRFGKDYFRILRKELRTEHPAATGYVQSMKGSLYAAFRVIEYTWGMEFVRRFQAWFGLISVIPGPTSIFRSDVFESIEFDHKLLTEDFDFTMQLHRSKLGYIQFIPKAKVQTQDPATFKDYLKQILRWNRGTWQIIRYRKVGRGFQRIDTYLSYQIIQNFLFFGTYIVAIPILTALTDSWNLISAAFIYDVGLFFILSTAVAVFMKRLDIIFSFPLLYLLRILLLTVFVWTFIEVIVFNRWKPKNIQKAGWDSARVKPA